MFSHNSVWNGNFAYSTFPRVGSALFVVVIYQTGVANSTCAFLIRKDVGVRCSCCVGVGIHVSEMALTLFRCLCYL